MNSAKVLVIDDDPTFIMIMERVLEELDVPHLCSSDPREAINIARRENVFLILLDVIMPTLSGIQAAEYLRGIAPIIFITSCDPQDTDLVKLSYEAGAIDYIAKPINKSILSCKIEIFKKIYDQNLRLSNKNAQLKGFCGMVAHDLKQPLVTIIGQSRRVLRSDQNQLCERSILAMDMVVQNASRMSKLIDSLLTYSVADNQTLRITDVDLNELVNDIVADIDMNIQSNKADIHVEQLPCIKGDRQLFYQVFLNLINNSIKFQPENNKPEIWISCDTKAEIPSEKESCEKAQREHSRYHQIVIEDNGIGFSEDKAREIFRPFSRLVSDHEYEGCGIGMGTVKKIIDRHDGLISASSPPGKGAVFTIQLPINFS